MEERHPTPDLTQNLVAKTGLLRSCRTLAGTDQYHPSVAAAVWIPAQARTRRSSMAPAVTGLEVELPLRPGHSLQTLQEGADLRGRVRCLHFATTAHLVHKPSCSLPLAGLQEEVVLLHCCLVGQVVLRLEAVGQCFHKLGTCLDQCFRKLDMRLGQCFRKLDMCLGQCFRKLDRCLAQCFRKVVPWVLSQCHPAVVARSLERVEDLCFQAMVAHCLAVGVDLCCLALVQDLCCQAEVAQLLAMAWLQSCLLCSAKGLRCLEGHLRSLEAHCLEAEPHCLGVALRYQEVVLRCPEVDCLVALPVVPSLTSVQGLSHPVGCLQAVVAWSCMKTRCCHTVEVSCRLALTFVPHHLEEVQHLLAFALAKDLCHRVGHCLLEDVMLNLATVPHQAKALQEGPLRACHCLGKASLLAAVLPLAALRSSAGIFQTAAPQPIVASPAKRWNHQRP
mmetsp:Transcript_40636/g.93379  ORF Transcript_40636/g.93379 Transcript_40636/m.93379 type:complete len:448 (-) Transcript_40636:1607-2950(-)